MPHRIEAARSAASLLLPFVRQLCSWPAASPYFSYSRLLRPGGLFLRPGRCPYLFPKIKKQLINTSSVSQVPGLHSVDQVAQ